MASGSSEAETEQIPFSDRFGEFDDFVPQNFTLSDEKIGVRDVHADPFSSTMAKSKDFWSFYRVLSGFGIVSDVFCLFQISFDIDFLV